MTDLESPYCSATNGHSPDDCAAHVRAGRDPCAEECLIPPDPPYIDPDPFRPANLHRYPPPREHRVQPS